MFYAYRQNNSGGVWDDTAPILLVIEAPNARRANEIAEAHGAYFGETWRIAFADGTIEQGP